MNARVAIVGGGLAPSDFGILPWRQPGTVSVSVLLESSHAPHRAARWHSHVKVVAGGACWPGAAVWDEHRIRPGLGDEVGCHHGAIPQCDTGNAAWLSEVDRVTEPHLHLPRRRYRGVGVAHLVTDAVIAAEAIIEAS